MSFAGKKFARNLWRRRASNLMELKSGWWHFEKENEREKLEGEKQRIAELSARFQRFRLKDGDYETAEGFMSIVNDAQRTLA